MVNKKIFDKEIYNEDKITYEYNQVTVICTLFTGEPNGFTQRRFEIKSGTGFPNSTLPFGRTISHRNSRCIGGKKRLKSLIVAQGIEVRVALGPCDVRLLGLQRHLQQLEGAFMIHIVPDWGGHFRH